MSTYLLHKQEMLISTQLRQSFQILQMSTQELVDYLAEEIKDNPILELDPYPKYKSLSSRASLSTVNPSDWWLQTTPCESHRTLYADLEEQLNSLDLSPLEYKIMKFIIGCLDETGYLTVTRDQVAEQLKVPLTAVDIAIHAVQQLEPAGIAASSLCECLLLQLTETTEDLDLVKQLISQDLLDLAKKRIAVLSKKYSVEPERIHKALRIISSLQPKPGFRFHEERTAYTIPDVRVTQSNGLTVISDIWFPQLKINSDYVAMMKQHYANTAKKYLREHWKKAKALIDIVEYRKMTLLQLTKIIFDMQVDFYRSGSSYITPLTMRQVAEKMGVHESTVSRTVNQKFVLTPWGVFELRYFFTSSVEQKESKSLSSQYLKERIRIIVQNEDKENPMSDQKITDLLLEENIVVSRRVVTKYRKQLQLLTAAERKRFT